MTHACPTHATSRASTRSTSSAWRGAALACAFLLGSVAAAQEVEQPKYGLERVLSELEELETLSSEALLQALVVAGPRALPELRAALDHELTAAKALDSRVWALSEEQGQSFQLALEGLPAWVAQAVDPVRGAARLDVLRTRIALDSLQDSRAEDACALTIALASPQRAEDAPHQAIVKCFEQALSQRLASSPRDARDLDGLMQAAHPGLHHAMVRAAGKAPSREVVEFLTRALDRDTSLDMAILAELGRVVQITRLPCDSSVELRVSSHLSALAPAVRREACLLAGRLELFAATGQLIEMLEDEDSGVRENAHWALETITGKRMAAEPLRWRRWHSGELSWWENDARGCFQDLRGQDASAASKAIRALSGHRQYRHEIAGELVLVLDSGDHAAQLCAALAALRSGVALPALVRTLEHESGSARSAAWNALKTITGRNDLPATAQAWHEFADSANKLDRR